MTDQTPGDLADASADLVLWLDGPYQSTRVRAAAATIEELVRRLNHATIGASPFAYPSELDRVVASLAGAAHGQIQLLEQLARHTAELDADPDLYTTAARTSGLVVHDAAQILTRAAAIARQLGQTLDSARRLTNTLGVNAPDHSEADQ